MDFIKELLVICEENKLKAYKIPYPKGASIEQVWDWVEDQDVVTIENIEKKGNTLYVYPHFEDKYNEDTLEGLKQSIRDFDFE